ncbi:unnamed protein product [Withania somnifera]
MENNQKTLAPVQHHHILQGGKWRACQTHEALQRKGFADFLMVFLCDKEAVVKNHLFLYCKITVNLWNMLLFMIGISWTMRENTFDLLKNWETIGRRNSEEDWWKLIPACVWWTLRKGRNTRYFEGKSNNIHKIRMNCIILLYFWCKQEMVGDIDLLVDFIGKL